MTNARVGQVLGLIVFVIMSVIAVGSFASDETAIGWLSAAAALGALGALFALTAARQTNE